MSNLITATIYYPGATSTSTISLLSELILIKEVSGSSTINSSISWFGDVGNLSIPKEVYNATNTVAALVSQSYGSLVQATVIQITTPQGSPYRLSASVQYAFPAGGCKIEEATGTNISAKITYRDTVYYVTETLAALTSSSNDGTSRKVKVAATQDVTSTSATDITSLSLSLAANRTYTIFIYIKISTSNTGGAYYALSAPSGTTIDGGTVSYNTTAIGNFNFRRVVSAIDTLSTTAMCSYSGSTGSVQITASITTGETSGNVKAQLAIVVGGETMTIQAGSFMRVMED